ncbi:hypothetical protein [Loktanella sp. S4079]|uniref:hypothetical protein n=1 Tax=Loktanella sp. S4079 TaxID=579483 RepID=UPI0005FA429C|nr:hypothetical protein [Loktanella sp. S4079]KJZ19262.1 hypothetical protein TW80_10750 [Loktanella sp. S4079]
MKIEALFTAIAICASSTAYASETCTTDLVEAKFAQAKEAIQIIGENDPDRMFVVVAEFQENMSVAEASADLAPICATYDAVIAAVEG